MLLALTTLQLCKTGFSLLLIVGAAGLAAGRYPRLSPPLRYLAWLTWFELPLELLGVWLWAKNRNNLFIMPFYTVGELALLALVYRHALRSAAFTKAVPWLVGGFALYTLADTLLAPTLLWYKPGQQVAQSLLLLGMVGLYFRQLLTGQLATPHPEREPLFWVSTGLILYFAGYLNIALFSNYMLTHYSLLFNQQVWTVHYVLSLVLHGCYCVALWLPAVRRPVGASQLHLWPPS